MMNIYWFKLFLTVMQENIRDIGRGGRVGGEELGKQLSFVIIIGVMKSCSPT